MGPKDRDRSGGGGGGGGSSGGGDGGGGGGGSSLINSEEWLQRLLTAIAKIKSQKQRPNLERITQTMRQLYTVSPDIVVTNLQAQVDAGGILYIENKGIESYADPKNPPLRTGRVSVRTPTGSSRAGDLVGKVVRAVREAGPGGATLKDITAHLSPSAGVVTWSGGGTHEDSQLPALVRHATKRALQRGFLAQSGKVFTLGTLAKHRKAAGRPPNFKKHHGGPEDDYDDDLSIQLHNRSLDVNNSHLQPDASPTLGQGCLAFISLPTQLPPSHMGMRKEAQTVRAIKGLLEASSRSIDNAIKTPALKRQTYIQTSKSIVATRGTSFCVSPSRPPLLPPSKVSTLPPFPCLHPTFQLHPSFRPPPPSRHPSPHSCTLNSFSPPSPLLRHPPHPSTGLIILTLHSPNFLTLTTRLSPSTPCLTLPPIPPLSRQIPLPILLPLILDAPELFHFFQSTSPHPSPPTLAPQPLPPHLLFSLYFFLHLTSQTSLSTLFPLTITLPLF
ncbi:hypothetical protein Pmani_019895 [Petrolisthes manimaculis]|uniref:SAMD1-like winged helix (WH) domain-containing protein n=1 Tax=Petrolisthes manimaculis TaxID=1843537 RepID=A0AAE1U551_9EUCA|nr:hypothetical protein Pmani_019895 [Petrolisthes manimaculis]